MVSILSTLFGFKELNIFGELIKILKIESKFVGGKAFKNLCDEPITDISKSKLFIDITPNHLAFITGLIIETSTDVGIVFIRKGEESSSVTNNPSRKPKLVDGGNLLNNSLNDLYSMNFNNEIKVGKGRWLTVDFDIESTVIKFIADKCVKLVKISVEDAIPNIEMKLAFGMLFKTPGDSESNPFKNDTIFFGGISPSAHWLIDNINTTEFMHCGGIMENNSGGEHANMLNKLMTISGGSGTTIWPCNDVMVATMIVFFSSSVKLTSEFWEQNFIKSSAHFIGVKV